MDGVSGNELLFDTEIVVFDLETTGLSQRFGDEIVEIGAVKARGARVVGEFQTLVNPRRPVSPGASAVNGITDDMLSGAPLITEALPAFLDFIGQLPLVAHNAMFDIGFVAWKIAELNMPKARNPVFDTVRMARALHPGLPGGYSLASMVSHFGLEAGQTHRASGDTMATWQLFRALLEPVAAAPNPPLTLRRALSLQGGSMQWPRVGFEDIVFAPSSAAENILARAIEGKSTVAIAYKSSGNFLSERNIKPIKLFRSCGRTYVTADCLLRNEQRIFRLDRITHIKE
ncbi:MAG TPA: exonuclease domain-containing protein [bacterium]|nr:exonuclease domain-containing protein [bacterium]